MSASLTIQLFHGARWHDAARLQLEQPELGRQGEAALGYERDYALQWLERDDEYACSLVLPVELMLSHRAPHWFGFLDDIMPSGAARRYWVGQLGLQGLRGDRQDFELLKWGTIAPVGNLRVRESMENLPDYSTVRERRFTVGDVAERHTDFLEYAQQMGAVSGGATGAGGEAPKLLLRCSERNEVWIDTFQDDVVCPDRHYLVKFPRGQRSERDCDILRGEYAYYCELDALGIDTIDASAMRLVEGEQYPSLWLPRFDVCHVDGQLQRFGLESVYSILHEPPATPLRHGDAIRRLVAVLQQQYRVRELDESFDREAFVSQWLQRDLLNIVFGNSDNHGRNTAFLKTPAGIRLSPVYDFAPMKADPEGIIRTLQWGAPLEAGGDYNWPAIAASLSDVATPERLMADLRTLAGRLAGLRDRLMTRGMPETLLRVPALGLDTVDDRLKRWELL
ncbi:MAG: HipA domain-containing protein [Pseudohongiellaceae bacterium]